MRRLPLPTPRTDTLHLRSNSRYLSGSMTLHQTDTGYEPNVSTNANVSISTANSETDTNEVRFSPFLDLTHDDDDTNSHMSDIPLQLPASSHFPSNNSALVTFSQAGSDPVQNVHSLQPIPSQTRVNLWLLQYLDRYLQSVPAVLGPQVGYTTSTGSSE